jgi:nucleotide-binding universal stress UspA family protein
MSVIVGYRADPYGEAALERGIAEALLRDLPLHVLQSVPVTAGGSAASARAQGAALSEHDAELERIADRARDVGVDDVQTHLVLESRGEGQFIHDLLELIKDVEATLVVIGMRDRSRVGKLVLGSRAQDVLLHVDCPVLAVKPPRGD